MCTSVEDLKRKADWDGALGQSRSRLLAKLQKTMQIDSDSAIIPEHRLESIFSQAIEYQQQHCLYHNVPNSNISLLSDHSCDRSSFPTKTQYILDGHSDEVWFVAFSANGKFLASASKDRTCIIWDTESYKPIHVLRGHSDHVSVVAWSPDSLFILTGSNDNSIKLWDVHTGANVRTFSLHSETITSLAFLPTIPASSFVSSSVDKNVFLWSVEGHVLHKWNGVRVTDLNVTADGSRMVTISDKRIRVFDLATKDEILTLQEQDAITSINTASDCRYTLVNVAASQEIHLWDMQEKRVAKTFVGHKQGRFVIRSCFGGLFQSFVLSGSEDSKIYVWNREQSVLLESLEGHRGLSIYFSFSPLKSKSLLMLCANQLATVNSISWSPNQNIFASASDDCTIRIWAADSHE
ncbi:WD40-repeat-containing domain protein [Obelidium mucronatum]|nr:WD40-repeat-containing domain protein [Obelidium mucronatum]